MPETEIVAGLLAYVNAPAGGASPTARWLATEHRL
jgi:hypothetical protein